MTNIHLLGLMSTTFVQSLYGPEKDTVIFHSLFYILYSYFLWPRLTLSYIPLISIFTH